jgi:hypothetical protein
MTNLIYQNLFNHIKNFLGGDSEPTNPITCDVLGFQGRIDLWSTAVYYYDLFTRRKGGRDGFSKIASLILHRVPTELNNDHDEYAEFS